MRKYCFVLLIGLFFIEACHRGAPPLDWDNFDAAHMDKGLSEKGRFDSYSIIFWQNAKRSYTVKKLADYAVAHGWALADSGKLDSLDARIYNVIVRSFVDTIIKPNKKDRMPPAWFENGVKLYKFGVPGQKLKKSHGKPYHSTVFVSMDESSACVYPIMDDS